MGSRSPSFLLRFAVFDFTALETWSTLEIFVSTIPQSCLVARWLECWTRIQKAPRLRQEEHPALKHMMPNEHVLFW